MQLQRRCSDSKMDLSARPRAETAPDVITNWFGSTATGSPGPSVRRRKAAKPRRNAALPYAYSYCTCARAVAGEFDRRGCSTSHSSRFSAYAKLMTPSGFSAGWYASCKLST